MTLFLQLIGIVSALLIMIYVLSLIRRKKLTDEYATLWLITSILFLIGSVFVKEIFLFYKYIKGASGSGLGILLFLSVIIIIFLLIYITSKTSLHQEQIKRLTQKTGILENKIRRENKDEKNK
jgi:hypothetical protein